MISKLKLINKDSQVLRAADKEIIVSKNQNFKFGHTENFSGDVFLDKADVRRPQKSDRILFHEIKADAKIKEELEEVKPVLDDLFERGKKKWGIKGI